MEECEDDPGYVSKIQNGILEGSWNMNAEYKYRVAEEGWCTWSSIRKIKCISHNDIEVVYNKTEGKLANEMQKHIQN